MEFNEKIRHEDYLWWMVPMELWSWNHVLLPLNWAAFICLDINIKQTVGHNFSPNNVFYGCSFLKLYQKFGGLILNFWGVANYKSQCWPKYNTLIFTVRISLALGGSTVVKLVLDAVPRPAVSLGGPVCRVPRVVSFASELTCCLKMDLSKLFSLLF